MVTMTAKDSESTPEEEKHALQDTWTLWFIDNKSKNWLDNMHIVYDFNTVEDFWCLHNHIKPPDELPFTRDYCLFKKGIQPMWEDVQNKRGGRWYFQNEPGNRTNLNKIWLNLLLFAIGDNFGEQSEQICGIVVNIRAKGDRINIWTRDSTRKEDIMSIGTKIKKFLELPNGKLLYEEHDASAGRKSSRVNYTYSL